MLAEEESAVSSLTSGTLEAYIPYTTIIRMADNIFHITSFYASSADEDSMDAAESTLKTWMLVTYQNKCQKLEISREIVLRFGQCRETPKSQGNS